MASLSSLVLCFFIASFNFIICAGFAEYVIFPGFETKETTSLPSTTETSLANIMSTTTSLTKTSSSSTFAMENMSERVPLTSAAVPLTTTTVPSTSKMTMTSTAENKKEPPTEDPLNNAYKPYVCPEEEKPWNIGPYEIPTQKDLVVHMKKTLMRLFNSYHKKALLFLNDIKEATQATSVIEKQCPVRSKRAYKLCVRHVNNQCQAITKSLVMSLERQRHDVSTFNESSICNVSSMKGDPVQLIKTLAMEEASLEFALPGFLRLLGACSVYCQNKFQTISQYWKKPTRHMSDQDLMIKHFLERKNYAQLIQGSS